MKGIRLISTTLLSSLLILLLVFQTVARVSPRKFPVIEQIPGSVASEDGDIGPPSLAEPEVAGPGVPQEAELDGAARSFLMRMGEADSVRRKVAEAVLKTVGANKGLKIVGVGSWVTGKKFVEGSSDFDMRLVMGPETSEAEAIRAWASAREELIANVRLTCGDKANQVLAKMNLYPPEAVLEGIDDAEEALSKLTNKVKINPNLGGETAEGLWGKGAKAFRDTYESTAGRAFWKEGNKITSGFADLLPIGETRGAYTIGGTANTASQFVDKVDDAIKQYDAKAVKKQLNRLSDELKKSRDLARIEKSTYLDDLLKKINAFADDPEGIEKLRKELMNPSTRQALDNALGRAKMDCALLKKFAESTHPRDVKILQEMLEEGTGRWARVKNAFSKANSYVPWSGLLKTFMAFMVIIQVKQATSDWKAGDYEKVFQSLLIDAGFLVSFPAGLMAIIVSSIIEDAKDAGYSLVERYQDCEDMLAGIYEVKGREQISNDQKAEISVNQLATKFAEREDIVKVVADHARIAASRGEGGKETKKVDAEVEKKLVARCTPEIIGKWTNRRAEMIGDASEMLLSINQQIDAIDVTRNVEPDPAILKNGRAEVKTSAAFSRNGIELSNLIEKYMTSLRSLGGDKRLVAVRVTHSYRWVKDGGEVSFDEFDFVPGKPVVDNTYTSRKFTFENTDPHTALLEYVLLIEVTTSADDVMAAKSYLTRTIRKEIPFEINVENPLTPTPTPTVTPTPSASPSPGPSGKVQILAPAEVTATEKFTIRASLPPEIAGAAKSFGWYGSADLINWDGERWLTAGPEAVMVFGPKVGRSSSQTFDPNQKISLSALDAQKREIGRAEITIKLKPIALQASAMSSWEWSADSAGIHLKRKPASKKARCGDKDCTSTIGANIDITWCQTCPANAEELKKTVESIHGAFLRTQNYRITPGKEESITIAGYSGRFANKTPQNYVEGNPEGLVDLAFPAVTSFAGGVVMKDGIAICFKGTAWGSGTRLGESGQFWFDDSPFVNQQGKAAYSEMMAILNSVTLGPDANVKQLPYKGPALDGSDLPRLKLVLSPNLKKLKKGDVVNVQAVVENDQNTEKPLKFEWTGDHAGSGASVQFLATKPGKQTLAVNVTDVGSAAVEFEVEDLKAQIIQVSPAVPKITFGSPATFSAQLLSGGQTLSGNYFYRWQPTPDVKFDPAEGSANQATAIFNRPGRQKVFVQVLEKKGEIFQTIAESEPIEIEVIKPDFRITFDPQSIQVGKEVKAVIQLQPADLKDIDFRWELTTNGKLLRESQDKREITFTPQDTKPIIVTARARVPFTGDDLGAQTATITATKVDVKVSVLGAEGPKPLVWKEGVGLVQLEKGVAVHQFVGLRADVTPPQEGLRYEWSLNDDSHFAGNNLSQQIRVSRSQTGTGEATVIVRDKNGIELGRATGSFDVTVSQADIDNGKKRASATEKMAQAKALVAQGKLDEGIGLADEAAGLDPKNTEASILTNKWKGERSTIENLLNQARLLMDQKKFADAAKMLAAAKQLHPKYASVVNAEKDLALRLAKEDSGKLESDTQIKQGNDLYEKDNYPAAINAYTKALTADPNSAPAYAGRCHAKRLSNDKSALADCEKAIQIDASNSEAYRGRSNIKRANNDFQGALADANRAVELAPGSYRTYVTRGQAKLSLEDLNGSLADFNRAIEMAPNDYYPYVNRGYAKTLSKDFKGALADYDRSIQINPNYSLSYYNRASVKRQLNDNNGALDDYNRYIRFVTDNALAYYYRGITKSSLADHAGALDDYNRSIQLDPKYSIAYYSRGTAKLNLNDNRGAIADLDQFLATSSKSSNGFNNRGLAHERLGNRDRAISDYETALSFDPNNPIAKANLARIKGANSETVERPPEPQTKFDLGRVWRVRQWIGNESWTWVWTRRGNTNTFDALARRNSDGFESRHVITFEKLEGNKVTLSRPDAYGNYIGTLSADRKTVRGTTTFAGNPNEGWTAEIDGQTPNPDANNGGGQNTNLALKRPAKQSSNSRFSAVNDAQGAVDGISGTDYDFHTEIEANPWWQVDLGSVKPLSEIRIFNRKGCCWERAATIQILLSNDGINWDRVYSHPGTVFGSDGTPLRVTTKGLSARFVRLQLAETNYLHLGEVEVYGTESPGTVTPRTVRPNLAGVWFDYSPWTNNAGLRCRIEQNGDNLVFINNSNDRSKGAFPDNSSVVAYDWQGGLKAKLENDGKRIVWSNGSVWERNPRTPAGTDRLGTEWSVIEGAGFQGRWVRRGTTNVWDAKWSNGAAAELTITISGDKVRVVRKDVGGLSNCTATYEGTLGPDNTIRGSETANCGGGDFVQKWEGRIGPAKVVDPTRVVTRTPDPNPAAGGMVKPPVSTPGAKSSELDTPTRGRLAKWFNKYDPQGVNPAFTYEEVISGGGTAIRTRAVGNTVAACETKWIKRVFDTDSLSSSSAMLEFDADFAFNGTTYNLPSIGVELLDAGGRSLGMKQFFGKNIIGEFNRSRLQSTGHIELATATGVHQVPLSRIGAKINFSKIAIYMMNYTCQGENSIVLRRVEIKTATQ